MKSWLLSAALATALVPAGALAAPMLGFTAASADAERGLEAKFDANLSPDEIGARLKRLAAAPNQVGSPHDRANAEWVLAQLKSWGWDARIETFQVLYPTPLAESLELVGPAPFKARLDEPPVPGDATSAVKAGALPPYLIYGADGDVTADLVYVNYGSPADYKALARLGVDVKGKIVIVRYGEIWRGLKVKLAAEHGAVGCIIYSDPADDGYGPGDTYPKGAWRPAEGVQRGSILDMPVRSGDPLTPDVGATEGAKRLPIGAAETLMKIPALPISYADAQPFLAALGGQVAPKSWRGALPVTYHVGPGPAQAHLVVKSDWSLKPLYDVIAVMRGAERPDEWVIRANHRDGWVFGAWDPLAGQSALLEEAQVRSARWRRPAGGRSAPSSTPAGTARNRACSARPNGPRRTPTSCGPRRVLYVNSDTNARGILGVDASYDTQRLVSEAAADVKDPETGASVKRPRDGRAAGRRPRRRRDRRGEAPGQARPATGRDLPIAAARLRLGLHAVRPAPGRRLDQPRLRRRGRAAAASTTRTTTPSSTSPASATRASVYGVALAKTAGRLVLRAADADVVPLQFGDLAAERRRPTSTR